ncbi:MAG: DUF3847 domain-containing protein [Oscillospiraceae bacterium]|nr:DUF3847 domain-containing protein [Oscillospiraceae bacterium]
MDERKKLEKQLADAEREIRQLQNRQKILENKMRNEIYRERTHRLCVHGGSLESVFPVVTGMDKDETMAFLHALLRLPGARELTENARTDGDAE